MTSKIVVNNIESDSGINTVTIIGDVSVGSSITATDITATHHGSGADLTNLPAANLTGTLPAIDGSNLTGVGASFGNSSVNTSGIITATSFVPTTGQLSHRNIIINGAMMVAQRTSSSTTNGYASLDRFRNVYNNVNENVTQSQVDVSSGTTPYTLGFRKALRITNGNQTSGDNGDTNIQIWQRVESQYMANSGWNYLSASSFVTLQFWVKSSVAQSFHCYLLNEDTTQNTFPFETGSLSADTWTKVTKTIPGNSNLTFNNDNGAGLRVAICPFLGSNKTANSLSNDTWTTFDGNNFTRDNTTTWLTTNDATFEITGVQLEVGPVATPFEHRNLGEDLQRCERYYQKWGEQRQMWMTNVNGTDHRKLVYFPTSMRAAPTMNLYDQSVDGSSVSAQYVTTKGYVCRLNGNGRHAAWKHEADAEL